MRILLIGEYSRLHWTLAEGLRTLGHEVVVASDGDGFKNYPRDIDLTRKSSGLIDTLSNLISILRIFSKFKGFDVVQLINPCFTLQNISVNWYLYKLLKKNNAKVYLGAFGDDYYWVRACLENKIFKYSEFFVNGKNTNLAYNKKLVALWIGSLREKINRKIATSANGIIACLYEYFKSYEPFYSEKLKYIPLPVNISQITFEPIQAMPSKVNFFIGVNKDRSEYKGTDIMEKVLDRLSSKYPDQVTIYKAKSLDYYTYQKKMSEAHVVLDQLYSYSPAMNALLAMAKGKIVVGGGEPEMYELIDEYDNHPIINVFPTEKDVFNKLEMLVLDKQRISQLSLAGRTFVEKHHNYIEVARQYLDFWKK